VCFWSPDLPDSDQIDRNPRQRVMSEEDQRYAARLIELHGEDYKVR
jgi:hypothetical protein